MEKAELIERAKIYLELLNNGVHPVTGKEIPQDSAFMDQKLKNCFVFITQILSEYTELLKKVESLESAKEKNTVIVLQKQKFSITQEQCDSIKLSKEPITILAFMKNINSAIDTTSIEKLTSTRINKWLSKRGLISTQKVQTVINKTVYKPTDFATKIGIVEEEIIDKRSGELKGQIKLGESAQLFIIENMEDIIQTT